MRPAPPAPSAPWQPAQELYVAAPIDNGPSITFSAGFSAMRYNIAHAGRSAKLVIAQNGIFLRVLAATTYAGSGITAFGAGASFAFAGAVDAAGVATAGVLSLVLSPDASARRALERFRRCSGISVTALTSRGDLSGL